MVNIPCKRLPFQADLESPLRWEAGNGAQTQGQTSRLLNC